MAAVTAGQAVTKARRNLQTAPEMARRQQVCKCYLLSSCDLFTADVARMVVDVLAFAGTALY